MGEKKNPKKTKSLNLWDSLNLTEKYKKTDVGKGR